METEIGAKRNNPGGVIDGQREILNFVQGRGGIDGLGLGRALLTEIDRDIFYFWRLIAVGAAPGVRTQRDATTMILQNLQRGTSLSFAVWHIAEPDFNE